MLNKTDMRKRAGQAERLSKPKAKLQQKKGAVLSLEMLMWAAIVGAVVVGIVSYLNSTSKDMKVQDAANSLMQMTKDTQRLFKSQGDFTGAAPAVLMQNGAVPAEMDTGANIISQWNGVIAVAPNTEASANDSFTFTYPNVTGEECSDFVSLSEGAFYRIAVAGTNVKDMAAGPAVPLNVATLGAQCSTGTSVSITFTAARY